jgi:hypothetical protein
MPDLDLLAAELAAIRERLSVATPSHSFRDVDASQRDVPRLLAAVEAVLKAASRWEGHTAAYCADETRTLLASKLLSDGDSDGE